jgi:hypothetical protein
MTVSAELLHSVRERAGFACEYCGVTETASGGELSVDHFQPQAHGGSDDFDNLLYCCFRCNLYKAAYWPLTSNSPRLWNPRTEPVHEHLLLLADGSLYPVSPTGEFTLSRLRLNRSALVSYRKSRAAADETARILSRHRNVVELLERLAREHAALLREQRELLNLQRALLNTLLGRNG